MEPQARRIQQNPAAVETGEEAIPHWHAPGSDTPTIVEGEDATVYDDEGNAYLDFISQLCGTNAGHSNRAITDAMAAQAERIPYVSSAKSNDVRDGLAADLAEIAPGSLSEVYFSISGSEANEAAVQIARTVQDAPKVLTRWQSYHGGTAGAGSLTGDPSTRSTVERYAATTGSGKFLPPLLSLGIDHRFFAFGSPVRMRHLISIGILLDFSVEQVAKATDVQ